MKSELSENEVQSSSSSYTPLSLRMVVQLAAPHTWPAAILPVLLAVALAVYVNGHISVTLTCALLIICILMQAAVNTINDYYDFVKGTDSVENQDDPTDAVLVYNNINPQSAFYLALGFLGVGFLFGLYIICCSGWIPLVIGIIGALIIMLYSAGKSPISYLPIGEYVSGITMGGLITSAGYFVLAGYFDPLVFVLALPLIIGIGLIMFTNNTCDIDKDIAAGRKTQAVLLGHKRAVRAYRAALLAWVVSILVLVGIFFTKGLVVLPFMLIILYPTLSALFNNPLEPHTRGQAMSQCLNANIGLGVFYAAAILFDAAGFLTL